MKRLVAFTVLALAAGASFGQYKYTTPDGRTVYSDQPPPSDARNVQQRDFAADANVFDTSRMPYELRRAVQSFPVTLYTAPNCAPCDEGRRLLNQRGVPFAEKTVATNDDIKYLSAHQLGSSVPVLTVGSGKQINFNASAWSSALDMAGYPKDPPPKGSYNNPAPTAAAPGKAADDADAAKRAAAQAQPPAPGANKTQVDPNNPAGIRF